MGVPGLWFFPRVGRPTRLATASDAAGTDTRSRVDPSDDTEGGSAGHIEDAVADEDPGRRWRSIGVWGTTALAIVLVWFALVGPDQINRLSPGAFARIPAEGLVAAIVLLLLPATARLPVSVLLGVLLGLLLIVKVFDMGFFAAFDRPFDPWADWSFLPPAVDYLQRSSGRAISIGAVIAAALLALAVLAVTTMASVRLTRLAASHRTSTARTVAALGLVWMICAAFGAQIVHDEPVASTSAARLAWAQAQQVRADLRDQSAFAAAAANDPFRYTPNSRLLTALAGKNVLLTFVESYGRVAVQDSDIAAQVDALLDAGTGRLRAAGYSARSAFLTSSTNGGGSWLAHSTLQSGLWIPNQQLYKDLVKRNRLTLTSAFGRAGWRTVGVVPGNNENWPEAAFYGYDRIYDSRNIGYRGRPFTFASIPDQYTMSAFQRSELGTPDHPPVFAEIDLLSSHAPWEPIPAMVDWNTVGDGSIYGKSSGPTDPTNAVFRQNITQVHADYGQTIRYSLTTLISYVERYGDDNLVLVFLGDHQPAPIITGEGATHDVPITIMAKDRKVMDRISGWGWQDGLRPDPHAPVWRMDAFRDRFLAAFGS